MLVDSWRDDIEGWLDGFPDLAISVLLVAVAVTLVFVALYGPKLVKPAVLVWVLLP
jgi:hypothetical protein